MKGASCTLGRLVVPHVVDQDVCGDDTVRVDEQVCKHRALSRAAQGKEPSHVVGDLDRTQYSESHGQTTVRLLSDLWKSLLAASSEHPAKSLSSVPTGLQAPCKRCPTGSQTRPRMLASSRVTETSYLGVRVVKIPITFVIEAFELPSQDRRVPSKDRHASGQVRGATRSRANRILDRTRWRLLLPVEEVRHEAAD